MTSLITLLSKLLDSASKGFLANVLVGAGLTLSSTLVVTGLVDQYIKTIQSDVYSLPQSLLMILGLSKIDYALSVVLSAVVARAAMNASGVFVKKK